MRLRILSIGLVLGLGLTACGSNSRQAEPTTTVPTALSTNTRVAPTESPTDTPDPTEQAIAVTVTYLDGDELEFGLEFASAKEPVAKGEVLIMGSTELSFSFKVVDFVRGEQALAQVATVDPAYAGPPAGYEVGLVRGLISHGNVHPEPVVLDGKQASFAVLSNGEYRELNALQGVPCCFEPRFDTPVAKDAELEIYFPILVALDDSNPLLVINRDGSTDKYGRHFALK